MVNGAARTYLLALPKTYDATKSYPLVVVLHGQPGTGASMHQYYPFEAASGDEAILAYPDGTNQEWDLFDAPADNADMKFIEALVPALIAKYKIDDKRVFGDGWSNGAFMLNQIACRLGLFRAISSHAGGAPYDDPDGTKRCVPVGKMPAIVFHGTADAVVDFGGAEDQVSFWAAKNGCGNTRSATTPAPCVQVDGCPAADPVHLCAIEGGNHGIWSEGSKTAWAFFKSLP